ncbi:MAG: ABC transporter permease [Bacilli bacterium]|nr:ABC transporter permease [Bacilli bacterium]
MEVKNTLKVKRHHKELFSIIRRNDLPKWKANLIRVGAIVISFLFAMALSSLIIKENYFNVIGTLFNGAFINPWKLFRDAAILLCFGIAILPPFKMKYWNMGSNGQVLFGAMMSIIVMFYLGSWGALSKLNNFLLILLMFVVSVISSIVWAVIPSIFKVFFKTNETLFTLMMNYIAAALVACVNLSLAKGKQETPGVVNRLTEAGWLPPVINQYFLPIIIIVALTVFIWFYMSKTKHGYEVTVVGDSINTARYVGMNTKVIIVRTLVLSGAICGILGFLYASAVNHCVSPDTCGSLGFTGILVAWLSNFNPLVMALVSLFLAFLTTGTSKVSSIFRLGSNDLSNVLIGIIFFSILISEFFIRYHFRLNLDFFKKNPKKEEEK